MRRPARPPRPAALALVAAGLALACVKRPIDHQRDLARSLRPAELQAWPVEGAPPAAAAKVLKVRAWVDEDFQAQTPRWPERIAEQLRRANRVLEPQFGRRLELVEAVPWPRQARPADLQASLAELIRHDPGRDVELVLGYVSGLRIAEASTERLGMAELGGRHLVLRAMVLEAEYDAMGRALHLLPEEEREALARERRVHREVAVLLHEWAHTAGAGHESLSASIMADVYHPQATGFSPDSVRAIEAGLRALEAGKTPAAPATPPPTPTPTPTPTSTPTSTSTSTSTPTPTSTGSGPPTPPGGAPPGSVPAPLPAGPVRPAAAPAPGAPPAPASTPPRPSAKPTLATLQEREFALAAGSGPSGGWLQLAVDADRLGAPATAERAAARAAGRNAAVILADARRTRLEVALPLEGVPPPREPEYVKAVRKVLGAAADKKLPEARAARQSLAAAFPGSAGLALADCVLAEAERVPGTAACEKAVKAFDASPAAHLHLGNQLGRAGRWAEARDRYRRALELDDAVAEPWSRLALALTRLDQQPQLRELQARYQGKFGFALRTPRE